MNKVARIAVTVIALSWFGVASLPASAQAQIPPELKNSKISFSYIPPENPKYGPIMQRLKQRELLEELAAFLSPLQLPHPFYLITRECKEPNAFYSPANWRIKICYEIVEFLERLAP